MKQQDMTQHPKAPKNNQDVLAIYFQLLFFPVENEDVDCKSCFPLSGQQLEKDSQEHAGILSRRKRVFIAFRLFKFPLRSDIFICCTLYISHFPLHEQVLGHQVSDEHLPDVNLIGEMGDVTELGKLVQLVLGCAVSCEKKQGTLSAAEERKKTQADTHSSVKNNTWD